MPAEAIHLSCFRDSLSESQAESSLRQAELLAIARLGSVAIDLPYFDRFPRSVARYFLKLPTATSPWGNFFHEQQPVGVTKRLLATARRLRAASATRQAGQRVLAFALGYASHVAVDRDMHPMVNALARTRAQRLGDDWLRQHTEVEKFQSVLFHEQRNGFDFMGRPELAQHIAVQGQLLHRDAALADAYQDALQGALGKAPGLALVARWARGYRQYTWLISSPLGKTMVPERVKAEVRAEVYDGPAMCFASAYQKAVQASRRALDAALAYADEASAEAMLDRVLPEGPIDGS